VIIGFLEDIIVRFGCPNIIIIDNAASFKVESLIKFCEQFRISLIHSTPYYPQGNGSAESYNKSLINIIKILLQDNKKAWDSKLKFPLWANRVTKRGPCASPLSSLYMELKQFFLLNSPCWWKSFSKTARKSMMT
jgi:transposase InsO family protein